MRRKRRPDEQENENRWVVSYADFVTLLFAFFTTMYALGNVDQVKLRAFSGSLRAAFPVAAGAGPLMEGLGPWPAELAAAEDETRKSTGCFYGRDGITLRREDRGLIISLGDRILFEPGTAEIRQTALPAMDALVSLLKKLPNDVVIEGHTDNVPVARGSARYTTNWELSAERATAVLRYFLGREGLRPSRFSACGYAEYRPLAPNTTAEGRARNRRVDIVVLMRPAHRGD